MNIYNQIQKNIPGFPDKGSVVVSTDSESLLAKDFFFQSGRKVVSDRDVFTLEYELARHMSQVKGLRILNDQVYPFLFESGVKRDGVIAALDLIKNFPDPFVEPDLAEVILEFLKQEKSAKNLLSTFKNTLDLASRKNEFKSVPRAFGNLYLNELSFDKDTYFFSSLLSLLPFGVSDKFSTKRIETFNDENIWNDQVELYELYKNDSSFKFYNFDHQLEEVRFALNLLSDDSSGKKAVLIPKNKGYEKLFYLYQREFFDKQVFFLFEKEEQTIERALFNISNELKVFHTYYDDCEFKNKNKIRSNEIDKKKYNLSELIDKFFKKDFTELDLNTVSSLLIELGSDRRLSLLDWKKILEQEKSKLANKNDKVQTVLNIYDYEHSSEDSIDEVWILGWSDSLFKKNGDKIFSQSLMSKLEINLGLLLPSLTKSEASVLFKNPIMQNPNISKRLTFSSQNFFGKSNKPGVFKVLMEATRGTASSKIKRVFKENKLSLFKERAKFNNKNLSASSLQRYEECPYKFYLEKVIGLSKEDDEDYFLSAKQEGSLMHKILEEEIESESVGIEKVQNKVKELALLEDGSFNFFREKIIKDLSARLWKILQEEKRHLLESSVVKTLVEKKFNFDVDISHKSFVKNGGDYSIRGVLDRIDVDDKSRALVYDYKRGDSGTHSLSMYKGTKLAPQLFLYCLAIDQGFLGKFNEFVGFQYINLSLYKRQKGFVIKKQTEGIAKEVPAKSPVDTDKYNEKMDLFLDKFWEVLEKINKEEFLEVPNPAYSGQCSSCTWLGVCKKSETFI